MASNDRSRHDSCAHRFNLYSCMSYSFTRSLGLEFIRDDLEFGHLWYSTKDFLEYIRNRSNVYLVSATPQSDLEQIIEAKGLKDYFKKVYGAPIKKNEILKKIMLTEKVSVNEILYIGDSPEDQQCAIESGVNFIGRKSDRDLNDSIHPVFRDFIQIKKHFSNHYRF